MREIKFRAWDKTMNMMIYQDDTEFEFRLTGKGIEVDDLTFIDTAFNEKHEDIDCEVMQYTGLKDKNGVEIYEGDIIRYPAKRSWENENFTSYIVWFDDRPEWGIGYKLRAQFHGALCGGYVESNLKNANEMLNIGNIYENPELLEVKNH